MTSPQEQNLSRYKNSGKENTKNAIVWMNEVPWSVRKSVCAEAEAQERKWYFIWFVFDASWWSIPGIYRKENVEVEGEQFAPRARYGGREPAA